MQDRHEPRSEFVERLGRQIASEARQRSPLVRPARSLPMSPVKLVFAAAALVMLSMSVGGAVVAAAYEARQNEQRDLLLSAYEQRLEPAEQRVQLARQQMQLIEQRVSIGLAKQDALHEARFKVREAEAQLELLRLQIAEIRLTGREPVNQASAPLVSGRDLTGDRWRVEMTVPEAALQTAKIQLAATESRMAVGLANAMDVEAARARVRDAEAALEGFGRKLAIRRQFLNGLLSAVLAELRVLEAEAELRVATLMPSVQLARKRAADVAVRVDVGTAAPLELAESRLHLHELEADLAKAEVDLALVRKQIAQHKDE